MVDSQKIIATRLYFEKNGNPPGQVFVKIISDDGFGEPSTNPIDVLVVSDPINASTIYTNPLGLIIPFNGGGGIILPAGSYHIVVEPDPIYLNSAISGSDEILVRVDGSAPPAPLANQYNGSAWTTSTSKIVYELF